MFEQRDVYEIKEGALYLNYKRWEFFARKTNICSWNKPDTTNRVRFTVPFPSMRGTSCVAAEFPYHLAAKENRDGGRNKNDEINEKRAEKKYME